MSKYREKSNRASQALSYYKESCLKAQGSIDKEDVIKILIDLRHMCDCIGWGYASVDKKAREHFMHERLT